MRDLTLDSVPVGVDQPKKFGTFLGVFTPSVLTILGVIMYQRLGWVVGEAGLFGALAIIALAHVISVTTGLSVASIATNRTVQTGGNYYIISRSLGLSIGGAIGLALYVALALSVSLYLIGFAEAFIAATGWTPVADPRDSIRLIGSAALLTLAGLTLWSTSLALKSQLFVLAAIIASLLAIAWGPSLAEPVQAASNQRLDGSAFATVFAVFFPAVTGFTAGVGMSGDLRDPKRAIPVGTIAAIGTGLVVYVWLTFVISERVSADVLSTDYNVLLRLSYEPWLVTAGVFAATLSSAMGSMLGAPRTLQALAYDGIVFEWLGRGKEPRIALAVTLLIAEGGVLVAELAVVGAVISMFFLTCYGFLCLACGLERWASPDFRPQFRVPIWVSLLGAVASFLVMFQINALAMFAAIVIMAATYAYLKRRQLVLGAGDTWGGVWSAVVRMGLMRLRQSSSRSAQRNWRPNMLVAGRNQGQNPLLDFGHDLVSDRGLLTHIHLVQGEAARPRVDREVEDAYPGIFGRTQGVEDIYEAIPNLAANYGLVGMETNTVLVGWPREAGQRVRYSAMIDRLLDLDLSVLMLRYDEKRGFGKREQIDVWWDGEAPTGPLMLTLAHLLASGARWKRARVRVLVNGRAEQDSSRSERALAEIIQDSRIRAEGVILPPASTRAALADRIRQESSRADLVMVHALESEGDLGFVQVNDELMSSLGTTLLVRPSKFFAQKAKVFDPGTVDISGSREYSRVEVSAPVPALLEPLLTFEQRLSDAAERFAVSADEPSWSEEVALAGAVKEAVAEIRQLERRLSQRGDRVSTARGLVEWARSRFTATLSDRLEAPFAPDGRRREESNTWERRMRTARGRARSDIEDAVAALPESVEVPTEAFDWTARPVDGPIRRLRKLTVRLRRRLFGGPYPPRRVALRRPAAERFASRIDADLDVVLSIAARRRLACLDRIRRATVDTSRFFDNLLAEIDRADEFDVEALRQVVARQLSELVDQLEAERHRLDEARRQAGQGLAERLRDTAEAQSRDWASPRVAKRRHAPASIPPDATPIWAQHQRAAVASIRLELQLEGAAAEARRTLSTLALRVRRELEQGALQAVDRALAVMERVVELRERYEETTSEAPSAETSSAAEGIEGTTIQAAFLAAADDLRQTFELESGPSAAELVDVLLGSLGRAAERISKSATLATEAATERALAGQPVRGFYTVPAQKLAQSFLERRVASPAQKELDELPRVTRSGRDTLVDAVRLVAFELEQVGSAQGSERDDDVEEAGTLALGGMLEERIQRLRRAREALIEYLTKLDLVFLDETPAALGELRGAVLGGHTGAGSAGPSPSTGRELLRRAAQRVQSWTTLVRDAAATARRPRARKRPAERATVVDRVRGLREALTPNPDVQAKLPLLYRRMFGRTALDTPDLVRGRDAELEALDRLYALWEEGSAGALLVVGSQRSGRSTLVNVWTRLACPDRTVIRVGSPPDNAEADVNAAIASALGGREGQSAEGALRAVAPGAVVILDELGPWLERSPGGFEALRLWVRLIRRLGQRHLFIVTATQSAFDLADGIAALSHAALGLVRPGPMSSSDLADLLLLRQKTADFEVQFGSARSSPRVARVQLERLHARTRGNVGDAVDLWRASVTDVTERKIRIDVRPPPDASVLGQLPDTWRVVLAAVALHRSVSPAKLGRVMRTSREEAKSILQDLGRAELVVERGGVWELDPMLQGLVLEALRKEGLLT